jgi:SET domain-containing protein
MIARFELRRRPRLRAEACMLLRTTQQCALSPTEHHHMTSSKARRRGPRIVVRRSGIHGRGVFARRLIHEDETVCEYRGEIISEAELARRYPEDMEGLNHTFAFGVEHDHNIDGGAKGNIARWINHSCGPNCDTFEKDKRIFVRAIRDIRTGEELSYDYNIEAGEPLTKAVKARWPCWCGAKKCRGTVLVPTPKPRKKKKA